MFLKSYVDVGFNFDAVRAAMFQEPTAWLDGLAAALEEEGERLLVEVGLQVGGQRRRKRAKLVVGQPRATDRVASLPIRLHLQGDQRLFPSLYGSLDSAWLGLGRTQLVLNLQYEPPLGLVGQAMDRTLFHRVAETAARDLLDEAARRLEQRIQRAAPAER
jgi:hypothetical protein